MGIVISMYRVAGDHEDRPYAMLRRAFVAGDHHDLYPR
jgi:hypothetical protein